MNDTHEEERENVIRGGGRVNARTAVAVEWAEKEGTKRAEGMTVDVSPHGCMVVLGERLAEGQKVRLINLATQAASVAVLAWCGRKVSGGWELGLQLKNPPAGFWNSAI
ncbi:MAG: hypothetical protein NVS9B13_25870 [Candidatus Acidiferrum sp.]